MCNGHVKHDIGYIEILSRNYYVIQRFCWWWPRPKQSWHIASWDPVAPLQVGWDLHSPMTVFEPSLTMAAPLQLAFALQCASHCQVSSPGRFLTLACCMSFLSFQQKFVQNYFPKICHLNFFSKFPRINVYLNSAMSTWGLPKIYINLKNFKANPSPLHQKEKELREWTCQSYKEKKAERCQRGGLLWPECPPLLPVTLGEKVVWAFFPKLPCCTLAFSFVLLLGFFFFFFPGSHSVWYSRNILWAIKRS